MANPSPAPAPQALPKAAFFSFASCEGCQLQVLSIEDQLLTLLGAVEIVNFREAIDDRRDDYDIAFIEGSLVRPEDIEEIQQIRKRARILIAIGACACLGGVNAIRNKRTPAQLAREVYDGRQDGVFKTLSDASPVRSVVQVDYELRGCPIDRDELLETLRSLLAGTVPYVPPFAVCVQCTMRGTPCMLERGLPCVGSVARAGCEAICPAFGAPCEACRGVHDSPNFEALGEAFFRHGLPRYVAAEKLQLFNNYKEIREPWEKALPSPSIT
ncbi:MAG: NADH:ubiquinone oxidoreductase [Acidobacteria bacterium]|jgi:coenzyme F420-reducing hydrogenase gamma subunit|nr:NADH:ubiquinone oxidoreductase [Acidobacteriota bacterium]